MIRRTEPWAASIKRSPDGTSIVLRFARPTSEIELTPDSARRLAAALLCAAEGREPMPCGREHFRKASAEMRAVYDTEPNMPAVHAEPCRKRGCGGFVADGLPGYCSECLSDVTL